MNIDYYDILGVTKKATEEEIKNAYKKKAKHLHPDVGGDAGQFALLNEAYKVLSNEESKKMYDATGKSMHRGIVMEEEAVDFLTSLFDQFIDADLNNLESGLLVCLWEECTTRKDSRSRDVSIIKGRIKKLETKKDCMKRKNPGENIFNNHIQNKINTMEQDLALAELDVKMIELAIEMLEDYQCEMKIKMDNFSGNFKSSKEDWEEDVKKMKILPSLFGERMGVTKGKMRENLGI